MTNAGFSVTVFRLETGEIMTCSIHSCDPDFKSLVVGNIWNYWGISEYGVIEVDSDLQKHYIGTVGGELTVIERPPIPYVIDKTNLIAGTGDYVTITGLHNPCTIVVDDPDPTVETATHVVTDGGFEFEPETAGIYIIEISKFPFLPATITITAIDAAESSEVDEFDLKFTDEFKSPAGT